jgi:beta-glucosidase
MVFKRCSAIALLGTSLSMGNCLAANAQTDPFSAKAKQKTEILLVQMMLDEKVGQLNESAGIVMPGISDQKPDELIIQGKVGSVLWLNDVKEIKRLHHLAVENPVSTFPFSLALS